MQKRNKKQIFSAFYARIKYLFRLFSVKIRETHSKNAQVSGGNLIFHAQKFQSEKNLKKIQKKH